jgi:hypothetical protein
VRISIHRTYTRIHGVMTTAIRAEFGRTTKLTISGRQIKSALDSWWFAHDAEMNPLNVQPVLQPPIHKLCTLNLWEKRSSTDNLLIGGTPTKMFESVSTAVDIKAVSFKETRVKKTPKPKRASDLLMFYAGQRKFSKGLSGANSYSINDFHTGGKYASDFDFLEQSHNFIQLLFPMMTDSGAQPNKFAVIDPGEINVYRTNPSIQTNLKKSLQTMMMFYGATFVDNARPVFTYDDNIATDKTNTTRDRLENMNSHTHNALRISRILHSLHVMNRKDLQLAVFDYFDTMVRIDPLNINWDSVYVRALTEYWEPALSDGTITITIDDCTLMDGPHSDVTKKVFMRAVAKTAIDTLNKNRT